VQITITIKYRECTAHIFTLSSKDIGDVVCSFSAGSIVVPGVTPQILKDLLATVTGGQLLNQLLQFVDHLLHIGGLHGKSFLVYKQYIEKSLTNCRYLYLKLN